MFKYCTSHAHPEIAQLTESRQLPYLSLLADTVLVNSAFALVVHKGILVCNIIANYIGPRARHPLVDGAAVGKHGNEPALK